MKKGFTLIELLVVITIIGILATGATALYTGSQQKSRDSVRVTDLMAYKTGVLQIYDDKGQKFPTVDNATAGSGLGEQLVANGYLEKTIVDAKAGNTGAGSEVLQYRYAKGDFNGVADQAYELSTAFEAKGNIEASSKAATDVTTGSAKDDERLEVGINLGAIDTSGSAASATLVIE